jgi:hypothetical protein
MNPANSATLIVLNFVQRSNNLELYTFTPFDIRLRLRKPYTSFKPIVSRAPT